MPQEVWAEEAVVKNTVPVIPGHTTEPHRLVDRWGLSGSWGVLKEHECSHRGYLGVLQELVPARPHGVDHAADSHRVDPLESSCTLT